MLRSDGPRERILLMGGWGTGKSTAAVDIITMARKTHSDAIMYVVDTTYEAARNFHEVEGVEIYHVETWDEYLAAIKEIRGKGRPQDWLVVDRIDVVWDMAQAGYSEAAFGKEIDEWFVQFRKDGGAGHAFSGDYGTHWGTIKRMYGAFVTELMRFPGHAVVMAKAEPVMEPNREGKGGDSSEVRGVYGKYGVRPGGEKNLGFLFHTTLWLNEPRKGEWTFTTIRDRGRVQVVNKKMEGFTVSYLVGVAGWKL